VHTLKHFQKEALQSLIQNPHTILIAPTGSGKSLIFQAYLAQFKKTRALLISPLNALARQHETRFKDFGIETYQGVGAGDPGPPKGPGVWILSPEKLCGRYLAEARAWKPDLLIVDEAHCIWEWGNHFRPEFAQVPSLVKTLKIKKSFWCTATLPRPALKQILKDLPENPVVLGQFEIPKNLKIERVRVSPHRRLEYLKAMLEQRKTESGMIFVSTRKSSVRIETYLKHWGVPVLSYHAGMSSEERLSLERRLQEKTNSKHPIWIVATSAFGMGMDYPFLTSCILFEPSFSLLSLSQALGRVGRGGVRANAQVLWHENDFERHSWFLEQSSRNQKSIEEVRDWCLTRDCQRAHLEKYFNGGVLSGKIERDDHP
jgi:ATP-dependent DNA helicase RecQ